MSRPASKWANLMAASLVAAVVPSCAVLAQTKTEPTPGDPCSTQLQQQSPEGKGDATDGESGNGQAGMDTGERLSRCGDVLQPPKTGDTELVKPAPEKGNMPVIKPKMLPKQQQSDPDAN